MQAQFIDDAIQNDRSIKPLNLVCKCEATISWYQIPNTDWQNDDTQTRIQEARNWFDQYCIHLHFTELAFDNSRPSHRKARAEIDKLALEYNALVARVPKARGGNENVLFSIQGKVNAIESQIRSIIGRKQMLVLFLDEWYVKTGVGEQTAWRESRVSATRPDALTIGIDRYDIDAPPNRSSRNILTHELTHSLRHQVKSNAARNCRKQFARANGLTIEPDRQWHDHYAGVNQDRAMSRPNRARAFQPSYNPDSDVLSVAEYLHIQKAGYVQTSSDCQCQNDKMK